MINQLPETIHILEECARNKQVIFYQELYEQIGLDHDNPGDRSRAAKILADTNEFSMSKNGTMLSSLVTLRDGNKPAEGFFDWAVSLNRLKASASDDAKDLFWLDEMKKVFKAYSN